MKTKLIVSVVAAIVVIGGAAVLLMHHGQNKDTNTSTTTPASTSTSSDQSATTNTPAQPAAPASGSSTQQAAGTTESFTITANDTSASPDTITAKKGDTVKVTFKVSSAGTYHGGLEFKSTDPAVDSGSIAEGSSGTVTFTANKSFRFTPYWYESSVQKDYYVNVDVQ
jgi:cytoskeletal protein RodZ